MKLNAFKVATLVLALASMLLPWISFSFFFSDRANFTDHVHFDLSPSLTQVTFLGLQDNTFTHDYTSSRCLPSFPINLLFQTAFAYFSHSGYTPDPYYLADISKGVYGFSLFFVIVALFAMGTWKSSARKIFLVALLVLVSGAILSLAAQIWVYRLVLDSWMVGSRAAALCFGTGEVLYVGFFAFNVGFFLAVLSILSLVLSYLYPRFVRLPIEFKTGLTQKLKEYWLAVPDRERLPAIFLTTFLAISSLFLTTLLL